MLQRATFLVMLLAMFVSPVMGQTTVRDINAIPPDNVTQLDAAGTSLDPAGIPGLLANSLVNTEVSFRGVVLTDPLSSGLASVSDGLPGRIHVWFRDVAAATDGAAGMDIQLVDSDYQASGLGAAVIGDVFDIVATVSPFGNSMQLAPITLTPVGSYTDFGYDASILAPVTMTTADINKSVDADGGVQPNWTNLSANQGQFVRIENALVMRRDQDPDRPNWLISTDNGTTVVNMYDVSLSYRNDRSDYPSGWNVQSDDFVPPPPGSRINIQGVLLYQRDDPFSRGNPVRELMSMAPMERSHLEITEAPPIVSNLSAPATVPAASSIEITADVVADASRTLTSVELVYTTSDNATETTVAGSSTGGTSYSFSLPAQADGVFVTYWIRATDSAGGTSIDQDPVAFTRFLTNGITAISHVQETASGGPGDGPFRDLTTDMNITATVMTQTSVSGLLAIQDGTGPWSGVIVRGSSDTDALNRGDVINITNAKIEESFGLTRLRDLTFTVTSTGGAALDPVTVTTTALQDASVAEAHEGMILRFEGIEVGTNQADAPSDFGEFTVQTAGTTDAVRVDDSSDDFSSSFNDGLRAGQRFAAITGLWGYSFGNYKLWPEDESALEEVQIGFSIRDVNAIPQDNVTALESAGTALDPASIPGLLANSHVNTEITFRAVVLSDPLSSGLASVSDGLPGRIHVWFRDVNAALAGPEGMDIQLVDSDYQASGLGAAVVGDVFDIVATVSPFGNSMQLAPVTLTPVGSYTDFGYDASILAPLTMTTADVNKSVDGDGGVQPNWTRLSLNQGQYARIENATVLRRDQDADRPNWLISSDGGTTVISMYDVSLSYRNDRSDYPDGWNTQSDDFVPPPPGSRINVQGFLLYQRDDPFARGNPARELISMAPMERSDLEITEAPPIVANLSRPDFVPGADAITVTADVTADPTRSLTSVELVYTTSDNSAEQTAAGTDGGSGTYSFTIPAQADGVFVDYWVRATDNTGAESIENDPSAGYRVLTNGITQISHIQETSTGAAGDSPFRNVTTDMNITATVVTDPASSGLAAIQDDAGLGAWSGVVLRGSSETDALSRGDVINITNARIEESFGLTRLRDLTFTVTSTGGAGLDYKVVTTDVLADEAISEAHEGMMLRFEGVEVGTNQADAPSDFGEFTVGTIGSGAFVRVDDASAQFSGDFNDNLTEGQTFAYIQGLWSYSFSNYKLMPESLDDVGTSGLSNEEDGIPATYELHANYPNPFNPATTISYDVAGTDMVRLEVFDVLGRKVSTLVNTQQTPGKYNVQFDARDFASGVYVYRLEAGSRVFTRTMLLLK